MYGLYDFIHSFIHRESGISGKVVGPENSTKALAETKFYNQSNINLNLGKENVAPNKNRTFIGRFENERS